MRAFVAALLFVIGLTPHAFAQPPTEPGLEFYRIGDFKLESGEVVRDFSIAYMTQGTLNAKKSNAVLMVTAISGNHHRIDSPASRRRVRATGCQMVVVAAGGHGSFGTKLGDAVVAYALR